MFKIKSIYGNDVYAMDGIKYWTQQEINVVRTFYFHYGNDYQLIASEMNDTFPPKHFKPNNCRKILFRHGPQTLIDHSNLSHSELDFIFLKFKKLIKTKNKFICIIFISTRGQEIGSYFPQRNTEFLRDQYFIIRQQIVRTICNFYLEQEKSKRFYCLRLNRMVQRTWLIIIYLAQLELPQIYCEDQTIVKICDSCKKLESYLYIFVEAQLYNISEDTNFLKFDSLDQLPILTHSELEDILEPLLVVEYNFVLQSSTLFRICQSVVPYDNKFQIDQEIQKKKKKSNKIAEDHEIPERQIHTANEHLRIYRNRTQEYQKDLPQDLINRYFLQVDPSQTELLMNSDIMSFLIPISTSIDQGAGRAPKKYHVD